jgi:hypothetical protein
VASWAVCLAALAIKNKLKKQHWIYVQARCLDREVRKISGGDGINWGARILCEFDHAGARIQSTPTVHWSTFRTEAAANKFLDTRISSDGGCTLRVNPQNPKEANLAAPRLR